MHQTVTCTGLQQVGHALHAATNAALGLQDLAEYLWGLAQLLGNIWQWMDCFHFLLFDCGIREFISFFLYHPLNKQ